MKSSALILLLLLVACGPPPAPFVVDAGFPPTDTGATLDAGPPLVGWTAISAKLVQSCGPCHSPGNRDRRVIVEDYAAIVGAPSSLGLSHIEPGFPLDSYLLYKVRAVPDTVCRERGIEVRLCGNTMPPPPLPQLDPEFVEALEAWIERGAPFD